MIKYHALPENPSAEVQLVIRKRINKTTVGNLRHFCFCLFAHGFVFSSPLAIIDIVLLFVIDTEQAWQLLTTLLSTPTDWAT